VKCLQIASGAVYTDDAGSWSELHDAKLQALDSILTEAAGAPVLVAYHWKHDLERLLKAFLAVATSTRIRRRCATGTPERYRSCSHIRPAQATA
jgi:hypothetical protein